MLAGIDIGTTGCKITVYDRKGNFKFKAYRGYETTRNNSAHEINALDIYNGVKEIIKEATEKYSIKAIGIDSFGEAFVMLDENDNPLIPIMTYTDFRGVKEIDELVEKLGADKIASITGLKPHPMYSLPKIMWIKKNQPEIFKKTKHILLMEDYIIYMLTGNKVIDYTLATRSMAFDINNLCWSKEILDAAELDVNLFAQTKKSGSSAGFLKESIKKELNINDNITITAVGHDQIAAAIGAGVIGEGMAVDGAGTVECITPVYKSLDKKDVLLNNNYAIVPFLNNDFVTYAFSYTSGSLVNWFMTNFSHKIAAEPQYLGKNLSEFDVLESGFIDGPSKLLVLPHFAGAATPYMDTSSKGAIIGLTLETTPSHIYQGILEGITYEMKVNLDLLKKAGIKPKRLIATGGGANSLKWLQIKADILNLPIVKLNSIESGSRGCAIMAGLSCGIFNTIEEGIKAMIKKSCILRPNKTKHAQYMEVYKKYKKLYKNVKELL